ncbi:MAG: YceD family protein [Solirubrobacterales bacterium]
MQDQASSIDLSRLSLSFGEAAGLRVPVRPRPPGMGGQTYEIRPQPVEALVDVSRTSGGYALRLRFALRLEGPCQRCLDDAGVEIGVDAREVEQPGAGDEELRSPYVDSEELDVSRWAQDAVVLALPGQILCRTECAGLCPVCGESLNEADPEAHRHDEGGDPRWAKLRELQ